MLTAIRERTQGWIAYVVVGLIVMVMALFGLYSYFTGPPSNEVATVNGREITLQALDNAYRRQRQQLEQMFGGQLDPSMFEEGELRRRVLDQLIDEAVLRDYIESQNYRVSDAALAAQIRSEEAFREDGRFSPERYRVVLRTNGLTPQAYEARVRLELALEQLQRGVSGSAFAADWEVDRLLALQGQERELAYLRIPGDAYKDEVEVTEADVKAFYEANQDLFRRPEQVKLAYVELDPDALVEQIDVSEEQLRARYEELKDTRFTEGGERRVRHILLTLPDDASEEQVAEARQQMQQWRQQIQSGEADFAELAKAHSDDPGSAAEGGDLGVIERGMMVERFEEAAYALEEGELSEPVRTDFGLHLIQATEVEPEEVQAFEEVRDQLRRELAAERAEQELVDRANTLATLAYEATDSLEPAAEELDLEVQQTDWIPRQGASEGLGSEQKVLEAAFSEDVLNRGYNSELIELEGGRNLVVRVAEHQPAEVEPLEAVADEVRQRLVAQRAADMARERAETLRSQLEDGQSVESLAQGPVEAAQPGFVTRTADGVPRAVLQRAFDMPKPGADEVSRDILALPGGDVVVLQVSAVREGDTDVAEEQRAQMRERLGSMLGSADLTNLVDALRAEADVEIYQDRL